jgi:hypothetical protein
MEYSNGLMTWYRCDNTQMTDENIEDTVETRFLKLYPEYDYSIKSSSKEKDMRKKKQMRTMY